MEQQLTELKARLQEVSDLEAVNSVLGWDQNTYMPHGGSNGRGRQTALIGRLAHEKFTDPAIGRLLDELRPHEESLPYDHDDASLIRVTRRQYERNVKVPSEFVARLYNHMSDGFTAWELARPENNFAKAAPFLEKTLDLSRAYAEYFAPYEHVADPLIDEADYGMKASTVSALFAELRRELVPLADRITSRPPASDDCLRRHYPESLQWQFNLEVARQLGYEFKRGRLDKSPHPFTTQFGLGDVRITTRVDEQDIGYALFSTIHEAGHAMYEQGIDMRFDASPLGSGTSAGVHESQSRLWENIVGRSRGFWEYYYPKLQAVFHEQLRDVTLDEFHRAVNKVQRSLIRTEADEVTYNLHVMIRFDLELAMLEGKLAVRDLPDAWRARYESDLGIVPPDDRDGCMQDVHWYAGIIGGQFQGYTLGNIMSGMWWNAALTAHPAIPQDIRSGDFTTLLGWLRSNIYQHGSKLTAADLAERITRAPLTIDPYVRYLTEKYDALYS